MQSWVNRLFRKRDLLVLIVGLAIMQGLACLLINLWLEAAYLSAPRVVTRGRLLPIDPFPNYERIKDVKCPVVMLHGTADSIIPYSHGRKLYDIAPKPKWFIPVDDAGHTDFIDRMGRSRYEEMLLSFVRDERLDLEKEVKIECETP